MSPQANVKDRAERLVSQLKGGVSPAMATPIRPNGYEVNVEAIANLVDFLIGKGVKGLFIGGTTGEGILLSEDQREILHRTSIEKVAGRVPVLVHVGCATTAESIRLAQKAAASGADAIVAVTPYFYPVHDQAQFEHFEQIASAAPETPFLAYDIPHMAVNRVGSGLAKALAENIESFCGLKCSHRDAQVVRSLIDALPDTAILLAGNERAALGLLALGAGGLISGVSTALPEPFVSLTTAFTDTDMMRARMVQRQINHILDLMPAGARIGGIKQLLKQRGIDIGPPVPPRPQPPEGWSAQPILKLAEESSFPGTE